MSFFTDLLSSIKNYFRKDNSPITPCNSRPKRYKSQIERDPVRKKTSTRKPAAPKKKTPASSSRKTPTPRAPSKPRKAPAVSKKTPSSSVKTPTNSSKNPIKAAPTRSTPKKAPVKSKAPAETLIGSITHYFANINVAVVKVDKGMLTVGDSIRIAQKSGSFSQDIESLQIESKDVRSARKGQVVGLKVKKDCQIDDQVFRLKRVEK